MKSPTSDQYYLLKKIIFLEIFENIKICLIIENIMYFVG